MTVSNEVEYEIYSNSTGTQENPYRSTGCACGIYHLNFPREKKNRGPRGLGAGINLLSVHFVRTNLKGLGVLGTGINRLSVCL